MFNISKIAKYKNEKIAMLTCYDFTFASIIDELKDKIDIILVGDSLSNVMKGEDSTVFTDIEDIIYHSRAVRNGCKETFILSDMPFNSYQPSVRDAVLNAGIIMKKGRCNAVKLEGGMEYSEHVKAITSAGIPVMGHLGLTPQSVNAFGGYGVRAKSQQDQEKLIADAISLEKAGAFGIVLECIPMELAKKVTETINIPTVGIGAGPHCDGQVLVLQDMLGMNDNKFKFVRNYANLKDSIRNAFEHFSHDVKEHKFPDKSESFK